jgi:hypothetical protein
MYLKTSIVLFALVIISAFFVPIVTNPAPVQCDNIPDGTGGYNPTCKDEYITLYAKLKMKDNK